MRSAHSGRFIAFEGIEGSGKSSQQRLATEALRARGCEVRVTAEPGGTALGRHVRQLVLHSEDAIPVPLAELFLYLADRAQHVSEVIRPALAAGAVVLCDRFSGSTLAYQGYARQMDLGTVAEADALARGGLEPDLNVLLDCPVAVGLGRARGPDRFHAEAAAFHERVRAGFLALAAARAESWHVIDSTRSETDVHGDVMRSIDGCLAAARRA